MNQNPWQPGQGAPPGWGAPAGAPPNQPPQQWAPPGQPPSNPAPWAPPGQPPAGPAPWAPPEQPAGNPAPWSPPGQQVPQQWPQQPPQAPPQAQQPQPWQQPAQAPQQAPQWQPQAQQPQQWQPQAQQPQQPQQWSQQQPPQQNWGGQQVDDPFAGLDTAMPEGQRGEFFEPGCFHVRIDKVTVIKSRKQKQLYTIETEVVRSDCPEQPAGTRCTAMVDLSNADMRDKNLLNFLAAVMGYDPGTFARGTLPPVGGSWSNLARMTLGADQPLRGREVAIRVVQRETRSGGEFSDLGWLPVNMLEIGKMRDPKPVQTSAPELAGASEWGGPANGAKPGWDPTPGAGPAGAWGPQSQQRPRQQTAPQGWNPPPQQQAWNPPPQQGRQAWLPPIGADDIPF